MKNIVVLTKSLIHRGFWVHFFALFFLIQLFSSCSKKMDIGTGIGSDRYKLTINITGVKGDDNGLNKSAAARINSYDDDRSQVVNRQIVKGTSEVGNLELDFISSSGSIQGFEDVNTSYFNDKFSSLKKSAAVVSMDAGVKYLFLIYKKEPTGAGAIIDVRLGTVGQPLSTWVNDVDDFIWYAYSFNSTEDIEYPDLNNPVVQTRVSDPLLFATGVLLQSTLNNTEAEYSLRIEFDQKLSKLEFAVDTRSLFADIVDFSVEFSEAPIATGQFNLKTNSMGGIIPDTIRNIPMKDLVDGSTRQKVSIQNYYTVNNLTEYKVKINNFTVQYPNRQGPPSNLLSSNTPTIVTFNGFSGGIGKLMKGTVKPYMVVPSMKFLTYGSEAISSLSSGLQGQEFTPSGTFLRTASNIGPNSKFIRITSPTFVDKLTGGAGLRNAIESEIPIPDVLICSLSDLTKVSSDDFEALVSYINSGGVVFLLTQSTDSRVKSLLARVLGENNLTLQYLAGEGALYKVNNVDPNVLNGVFGETRNTYWGLGGPAETKAQYIFGISNPNNLVFYTRGSDNFSNDNGTNGVTMFRHKSKHLFFCGDTRFLSGSNVSADYSGRTTMPYWLDPSFSPKLRGDYGSAPEGGSVLGSEVGRPWKVSNSIIFGNALAWLIERAYFWGYDDNGTVVNDEVIQTKETNWNFRRD